MEKKIEKLLKNLEALAERRPMFNVPREAGEYLNLLVKINKPKKILEVGTSNGYSTIWLAHDNPQTKITTIEIKEDKVRMAKKNIRKASLTNVEIIHGDAMQELPKLKESFDLIFLDAIKKDYLNYLKLLKLNKGTIVIADNILTHPSQVQEYVNHVRKNFKSELINIGNGMEVTIL